MLQQQCATVFRFAADSVFSSSRRSPSGRSLIDQVVLTRLEPARQRLRLRCSWASPNFKAKTPPSCNAEAAAALQVLVAELLESDSAAVACEFCHCSARLTAQKEHIILGCRPTLHGRIFPCYNVLCQFLDSFDAERLGRKPSGSLLRKARQRQ